MARDQALRRTPPPDRACHAKVTDPRSKNVGGDCPNWSVRGESYCSAHLGIPQRQYQLKTERLRILGVPEEVEDIYLSEQAEKIRAFRAQQEAELRKHQEEQELRRGREEKARQAASVPPPLTHAQKEEGLVYHRNYNVQLGQAAFAHLDEEKRAFTWQLIYLRDLVRQEQDRLVHEHMAPAEDAVEEKLTDIRQRLARSRRKFAFDPLHPSHRRGAPRDPLEDELERYEPRDVDLSPEALGLRP